VYLAMAHRIASPAVDAATTSAWRVLDCDGLPPASLSAFFGQRYTRAALLTQAYGELQPVRRDRGMDVDSQASAVAHLCCVGD